MKEISFKMTITLGGGVNINCIYYTIFSKVLCLTFCQIPSPYQDSHMQIRSGSPGENSHTNSRLSTLMQLLFSFDQELKVEKTLIQTLACQLSSIVMQLLFSFDQDTRVEKTLLQTLACQLSSTLMQLLFSFDQDMRLRKLSYKLNLYLQLTRA